MDIIPFDGVEDENRTITWPNDHRLDVLGFHEALEGAATVQIGEVSVKVASLPAQVILKLLAWRDRHLDNSRDAIDLRTIILAYSDEPYLDRVYQDHDALEAHDSDLELAGADRIGSEAISLMGSAGATVIRTLVDEQCAEDARLPAQMSNTVARNRELLASLRRGMHRARTLNEPEGR